MGYRVGDYGDITEERLAAIRKRCEAATPGPWTILERGFYDDCDIEGPPAGFTRGQFANHADALFISSARDDVPWLLGLVERLMAELEQRCLT